MTYNKIPAFPAFSCNCFVVACQEIYQLGRHTGDIAAMECLLNHLEKSSHPKKWHKFVDALELKGKANCVYFCNFSQY